VIQRRALALVFTLLALVGGASRLAAQDAEAERAAETRLESVRAEIREIARVQRSLAAERDTATAQVREVDEAIAARLAALKSVEADVQAQQQRFDALEAERAEVAGGLQRQREALAALVRAAYVQGGQAPLRLLLSQDRLSAASRALAYHRYVQRGQVRRIRDLLEELAELARVTERVALQRSELDAAMAREQEALAGLESQRADRAALLLALGGQEQAQAQKLAELRRAERGLLELLESLRDIFADIPDQLDGARPFAEQRGRLPPPLSGKISTGYAGTLPDGRRSEGWLMEASAGAKVTAVAHGRVAFADWMNGYGLLLIIDHGDDYLSLYAHNDGLLRDVGDWVDAGEAIAQAGSSGGQGRPALYFELRRKRQSLDPRVWIQR
jgi:septal ring factor EnvC (AmiA/AmiB activator)